MPMSAHLVPNSFAVHAPSTRQRPDFASRDTRRRRRSSRSRAHSARHRPQHGQVALAGAYKVALSTSDGLAATLLRAVERGFGPEWIDEYPRRLRALTLAEANDAIRKSLNVDRMVTVMAGTMPAAKVAQP